MTLVVRDNPEASRYEVFDGDRRIGLAQYRLQPGRISFTHTETDPDRRGEGVADALVRHALDDARVRGLDVLPFCPFVRAFIARNESYLDLVPGDRRGDFGLPE